MDRLQFRPSYLAVSATCIIITLSILSGTVSFFKDDILMHLLSGIALALIIAAFMSGLTHSILITVFILGIIWEPIEWFFFIVDVYPRYSFIDWMTREDTLFDISLAYVGAVTALIGINRYQ
jgi:hypothetical protein